MPFILETKKYQDHSCTVLVSGPLGKSIGLHLRPRVVIESSDEERPGCLHQNSEATLASKQTGAARRGNGHLHWHTEKLPCCDSAEEAKLR